MIGKNTIKLINSLSHKKYRSKENLFIVEGDKMVAEVIDSDLIIKQLFLTNDFHLKQIQQSKINHISKIDYKELKQISLLKTPQNSLALCQIPASLAFPTQLDATLSLYLDGIQDPGNLGTILRICDWYGISQIFASKDTVDIYHPRVIQASMGSFYRVNFWECDFDMIQTLSSSSGASLYGAFMDGKNIYQQNLPAKAILVMGNEGQGIRKELESQINHRISIPNFSPNKSKAESLNVSVATAIICSEFKRRDFSHSK